jgi:exodeoxyribonuclease V alpha subunit
MRNTPVIGEPGVYAPLILDDQARLYLYRYWDYQQRLADLITQRVENMGEVDLTVLKAGLDRLFDHENTGGTGGGPARADWQKIAAAVALTKAFCVISGGPGTGKTTTVAKILAVMLEQPRPTPLRIALAAPTGKAAMRLQGAIKESKKNLDVDSQTRMHIPEEASTIHRLLGGIAGSPYFRHDKSNPLAADVVVVDEASMVDLALMSKLVQSLQPHAQLVLLGDKDQLASVEAGAVLGDMCDTGGIRGFSVGTRDVVKQVAGHEVPALSDDHGGTGMADCVVRLQKNFRFGQGSGIGALSRAVNAGDGDTALSLLIDKRFEDLTWQSLPPPDLLLGNMKTWVIKRFQECFRARNVEESFALFDRFRILCALREGPYGVVNLNRIVEKILVDQGLVVSRATWYPGRPVMINRNDYNLRLFNGDVGITWHDPESQGLGVFFLSPDSGWRKFHPIRLPEHETVFAMTVHKSQGSEFDEVLVLLTDRDLPVLTRELLYTAITRARDRVALWGKKEVITAAISRRIQRMSGLRDALWERR